MAKPGTSRRVGAIAAGFLLALSPIAAARIKHISERSDGRYTAFYRPLSKPERLDHALGRLTFGPEYGDLQQIERTGVDTWIKHQLHPDTVPENLSLAERLQPYDSLRMSIQENCAHYPPPQLIRAVARGRGQLPDDPELRALVIRLASRYRQKRQIDVDSGTLDLHLPGSTPDVPHVESKVTQTAPLSPIQIGILDTGSAAQKKILLASIPPARQRAFAWSLQSRERQQLMNLAPVDVRRELMLAANPQRVVVTDLSEGKLLRAIYSKHQLQEVLVDFWFNHFNVFAGKGTEPFLLASYERDAIRPHVLGKFHDLLLATAESPAMLFYLDNWQSVAPATSGGPSVRAQQRKRGLNENYGRELLELHTLGVNGGYTQKDVIAVARCFTGWTMQRPEQGGAFRYNDKVHDHGAKVVLGHAIPAGGGISDGLTVLNILAHHPATAHFISLKLAQKFVADDPPPALVNRMAKTFSRTDGDLLQVMQTMLTSREFWSQGAYQAKVKTPFEMIVSAVRATSADVDSAYALSNELRHLGEPLYGKIEPTGYSTLNADWVSSAGLLGRMNFALALAHNRIAGARIDTAAWQTEASNDISRIARSILQRQPGNQTLAAINKMIANPDLQKQFTASSQAGRPQTFGLVAGLVLGSPEFQRH